VDTLNVELGTRSYPILIDAGLIGRPDIFRQQLPAHDVLVVSNTTVAPLYGEIADLIVSTDGRRVHSVAEQILRELAAARATP
jgi:3-dehydroquinate synthase